MKQILCIMMHISITLAGNCTSTSNCLHNELNYSCLSCADASSVDYLCNPTTNSECVYDCFGVVQSLKSQSVTITTNFNGADSNIHYSNHYDQLFNIQLDANGDPVVPIRGFDSVGIGCRMKEKISEYSVTPADCYQ